MTDLHSEIIIMRRLLDRYLASQDLSALGDPDACRDALLTVGFTVAQVASLARIHFSGLIQVAKFREIGEFEQLLPEEKP